MGFAAFYRSQNPLAWAIVPLIIGTAWMLGDGKRLLGGYWLWATISDYAYQLTGESVVRHGDKAILGLILVALLFDQALRRRRLTELRPMFLIFFLLMALFGASYLVNGGSALGTAVTAVQYYRPFVLGYAAYVFLKPEDLPSVTVLFVLTLLFQLFLNACWMSGYSPLPHPGVYTGVDFAVGTMGSSLMVGYTACMGLVLSLALALVARRRFYYLIAALLLLSFVLTNTMHAYVFLVVMLGIMAIAPTRSPIAHLATITGVITILGSLLMLISVLVPDLPLLEEYVSRGRDLLTGRKMEAYRMHVSELSKDVPVFLLGAGPGNLGCAMADDSNYLTSKYHGYGSTMKELAELAGGSITSHTRTGYLSIWSDMGPIAFFLYWGAHFYAMLRVGRAFWRNSYAHPWQRAYALAFLPVMLLYLMVAFMTDLVHTSLIGFVPWVWAAIVWTPLGQEVEAETYEAVEPVPLAENPADA